MLADRSCRNADGSFWKSAVWELRKNAFRLATRELLFCIIVDPDYKVYASTGKMESIGARTVAVREAVVLTGDDDLDGGRRRGVGGGISLSRYGCLPEVSSAWTVAVGQAVVSTGGDGLGGGRRRGGEGGISPGPYGCCLPDRRCPRRSAIRIVVGVDGGGREAVVSTGDDSLDGGQH